MPYKRYLPFILLLSVGLCPLAAAQDDGDDAHPFAEHHLLLQLSDADPTKRDSVLNVASNVMKHYGGPDFVAVEVIVFDRGIDLVLEGSKQQERLTALANSGVKFIACGTTLTGLEARTREKPVLIEGVSTTPVGVAYVLDKVAEGYVLVKP